MSCLDEETIAAFAETRLPPEGIATLEAHVRDCASCRELVSLALASTPERTAIGREVARAGAAPQFRASPPGRDPNAISRGTSIGRYTVLGLVGRGGMGEVYSAYDAELDRKIALKVLNPDADADDTRGGSRLLREAKAIARVHHPNVVVVHDTGSFANRVFIAMEYVEGETLAAWLAAQPRAQDRILSVFAAAGRGLQAAHEAGLVHRDFKPQNVMVADDGGVRVMDFGLARAIGAAADPSDATNIKTAGVTDPVLTRTGELVGTPLYMAPEQFAGQRTDARTDQFSFCVALYQALYGVHPFFTGKQLGELMAAVGDGHVQPPPAKSAVAPWLRKTVLRGLAVNPDDRFPSMAELLEALAHDPAERRRRWIAVGAATLAAAGIAFGAHRLTDARRAKCDGSASRGATAWNSDRRGAIEKAFLATGNKRAAQALASTTELIDRYVARWVGVHKEACEATHLRNEQSSEVLDLRMACLDERLASVRALTDTLAAADANVVAKATGAAAALPSIDRCSDVSALKAVVRPPDDRELRRRVADLREQLATVAALASAGRCEQATRLGRPLMVIAKQIGYLPLQAEAFHAFGRMHDSCLDTKEALAALEDAFMAAEASRYDEVAIDAAATLAAAYAERTQDFRAARDWLRLAETILARFPNHPALEARIAMCRSVVLLDEGRLSEALEDARRSLTLHEKMYGPSSFEVAMASNIVGIILHELARDAEALAFVHNGMQTIRRLFGDDAGQLALYLVNEAEILTALGRFEDAHHSIEQALKIWREQDAGEFLIGYGLLDQGKLQLAEGRPALAAATLEKSSALLHGQDARFTSNVQFALARALFDASPQNRSRAVALAGKARAALLDTPSAARLVREIERWQREHPEP